jgi:predicted transposase/invertase (TIGR01784 family)
MKKKQIFEDFVSPMNDYVFKSIYGEQKNIDNTRGLLKAILEIPPEDYHELTVVDPFLKRRWRKDKQGIVDLRLSTASGRQLSVELQVLPYKAMLERIVYYNARITADQMKSGSKYETLRQSVSVVITNYTLLPGESSYLNRIELRNRESGALFTDLQQYVILELTKLPEEDDGQAMWPYMKFFKCRTEEEFEMLWKRHPEVKKPVEEYRRLSRDERRRLVAYYRDKQKYDAEAALDYARDEGLAQGLAQGREQGLTQGREQGLTQGREQGLTQGREQGLTEGREQGLIEGRAESQQALAEKDRENQELRRLLREAGIDPRQD